MASRALPFWPRVQRAKVAAAYAGYGSERDFLRDVSEGVMPAPFVLNGANAWDMDDLNASIDAVKAGALRVSKCLSLCGLAFAQRQPRASDTGTGPAWRPVRRGCGCQTPIPTPMASCGSWRTSSGLPCGSMIVVVVARSALSRFCIGSHPHSPSSSLTRKARSNAILTGW
jgi:hypothetical protein